MADIKWGRTRPWDGSKGCPPVAEDEICAVFEWEWVGLDYPGLGCEWTWIKEVTAYRIPAEFDHLDDSGNPTGTDIVERLRTLSPGMAVLSAASGLAGRAHRFDCTVFQAPPRETFTSERPLTKRQKRRLRRRASK